MATTPLNEHDPMLLSVQGFFPSYSFAGFTLFSKTLSSTARVQRAQQGVVRKGACVTTDGSRGQRLMDLRALLRDKFTSPPPPKEHVPVRRQRHGKENQKGYSHRKIKLQREREYKLDQAHQEKEIIQKKKLKRPSRRPPGGHTGRSKNIHRRTPSVAIKSRQQHRPPVRNGATTGSTQTKQEKERKARGGGYRTITRKRREKGSKSKTKGGSDLD